MSRLLSGPRISGRSLTATVFADSGGPAPAALSSHRSVALPPSLVHASPHRPRLQNPPPGPGPPSHGMSPRWPRCKLELQSHQLSAQPPTPRGLYPSAGTTLVPEPRDAPHPVFTKESQGCREHRSKHPKAIREPLSKEPSPAGPRLQP